MPELMKSVTLGQTEGSTDKLYFVNLFRNGDTYSVAGANCRRGATPIPREPKLKGATLAEAEKFFDKFVASRIKDGYTIENDGDTYDAPHIDAVPSGIRLQMLTPIDEPTLAKLLDDPRYGMMEKMDGDRRALHADAEPRAINKKGFCVALSSDLRNHILKLPSGTITDGELIGNVYHAFDLLSHGNSDVRSDGFGRRYELLEKTLSESSVIDDRFRLVRLYTGTDKARAFTEIRDRGGEGVVFKLLNGTYEAGRNTSLEAAKFKNYATATVMITGKNPAKSSLTMQMFREGAPIDVGSVTIPQSMTVPPAGAFAEVRYLYVLGADGALIQPTFLSLRDDVDESDCDYSLVKRKPA